jgi:hypothetical protein
VAASWACQQHTCTRSEFCHPDDTIIGFMRRLQRRWLGFALVNAELPIAWLWNAFRFKAWQFPKTFFSL